MSKRNGRRQETNLHKSLSIYAIAVELTHNPAETESDGKRGERELRNLGFGGLRSDCVTIEERESREDLKRRLEVRHVVVTLLLWVAQLVLTVVVANPYILFSISYFLFLFDFLFL